MKGLKCMKKARGPENYSLNKKRNTSGRKSVSALPVAERGGVQQGVTRGGGGVEPYVISNMRNLFRRRRSEKEERNGACVTKNFGSKRGGGTALTVRSQRKGEGRKSRSRGRVNFRILFREGREKKKEQLPKTKGVIGPSSCAKKGKSAPRSEKGRKGHRRGEYCPLADS